MNTVWHGDVIENATESMVKVSKGKSWSLHCEYNGEAQAACGYTVEREAERRHAVWVFERKKKSALKHSIIYVPAASLSPQPLLLERERESIRKAANGKRGLQSAEAQHCSLSWEERGREPLAFSSIRVCARVRLVDTAAVLALAGDLCSIFQNAQQPHWMRRGRWGTQQSGWVVWSCNWECVCVRRWWANVPFYRSLVMIPVQAVVCV